MSVRVRFAPSPTGPLHIGGVRTALYNYLFARKHGGSFILRIEDTDQARFVPGAEEYIIESLNWCGIHFDEGVQNGGPYGPYRQSDRKNLYMPYAEQLIEKGYAYYAFDTPEALEQKREEAKIKKETFQYDSKTRLNLVNSITLSPEDVKSRLDNGEAYVIRIKIPENEEIRLNDIIRGEVIVNSSKLDDKVLFKSDGMPTYHLANVVDDHEMKITHVIRGEEWLPSAPLHVLLYHFLGWENEMPEFAHLPLLLKPDGNGKLSKRDGDRLGFPVFPLQWTDPATQEVSSGYRESGYLSQAFVNFLAFLGWNPGTEQEIFNIDQLIDCFSLGHVHKSGAKFDLEKAKWYNQQYIKNSEPALLATILKKYLDENSISFPSEDYLQKVCALVCERAVFLKDLYTLSTYFFIDPKEYDAETLRKRWKDDSQSLLDKLAVIFEQTDFSQPASIDQAFHHFLEENQLGAGAVLSPLRLVITGLGGGPSMFDVMHLIGKEKTLLRMKKGIVS